MTERPLPPLILRITQGEQRGKRYTVYVNLANVSTVNVWETASGETEVELIMLAIQPGQARPYADKIRVLGEQAQRVVALLDQLAEVDYTR
jgi:hypothetical protein